LDQKSFLCAGGEPGKGLCKVCSFLIVHDFWRNVKDF
jgi:hypothetical protein